MIKLFEIVNQYIGTSQIKLIKNFKTEEGKFSVYDIDTNHPNRPDMFVVLKDKDGYIIRNSIVPDNMRRKGIATNFYIQINNESMKKTGKPLRTAPARKFPDGKVRAELTPDAEKLWDSLVEKGLAKKLSDKNYKFK